MVTDFVPSTLGLPTEAVFQAVQHRTGRTRRVRMTTANVYFVNTQALGAYNSNCTSVLKVDVVCKCVYLSFTLVSATKKHNLSGYVL